MRLGLETGSLTQYDRPMLLEIIQAIGRLRRAQPRNADTMLVCDELEKRIAAPVVERLKDKEPWKAAGISRATWFRRKRKEKP